MEKAHQIISAAFIDACDSSLDPFLRATTEREADRHLQRLYDEFISPTVYATLARELRRSQAATMDQLAQEEEIFREIAVVVSGSIAIRLRRLRESLHSGDFSDGGPSRNSPKPLTRLSAYAASAARHATIDYLRRKRPGRRALDTALQATLTLSNTLACWRVQQGPNFEEMRCGRCEWRNAKPPVKLAFLRHDLDLQRRLRQELISKTPQDALLCVFEIVQGPLLYDELLDFLADLWDVEAPYQAIRNEHTLLRAPRLTATPEEQPEHAAIRIGTFQEIWEFIRILSAPQAATLLLHLPSGTNGSFLSELIRLGLTSAGEAAEVIGIPLNALNDIEDSLPLDDQQIATLIEIEPSNIRRIRQDARRRLTRLLEMQNKQK